MSTGRTILAAGGAGYIGSHTVVQLIERGYECVILDNFSNSSPECISRLERIVGKKIICYEADICDRPALDAVFEKHQFYAVIHFAGLKAVGESCAKPLEYYRVNVGGTANLLECMKAHNVNNLVFSSSATVYGPPQYLPLDEKHPTGGCTNPYGNTKFIIEMMLKDLATASPEWNIVALRYFNPVGAHKSALIGEDPRDIPNNLMPYIAQVVVGRRSHLNVYGSDYETKDGTGVRDYIHVVDLAQGHVAALKKIDEKCGHKIFNLGTGTGYSVLEMLRAMERACGKEIPYKFADRRAGDVPVMCADPTLALNELGWKTERGVDEMCADTWKFQSQNPMGYESPIPCPKKIHHQKTNGCVSNGIAVENGH